MTKARIVEWILADYRIGARDETYQRID